MPDAHELLKNLTERLHTALDSDLESVILYGSAADGDFHKHSDLNVLCVTRSVSITVLARASDAVRWWTTTAKQPAPLFFTAAELRSSADVFAIEFLDMQKNHRVLYGSDPIAGLHIPMNLHRLQVEHELRTVLLKLRQHILRGVENRSELAAVLGKATASVATLLRHTLLAMGEQPANALGDVFARVAARTGADAGAFKAMLNLREAGKNGKETLEIYGACMTGIEKVIAALDQYVPKHEWQRTASTSTSS
jgi:predicted nucleotidyltransferase